MSKLRESAKGQECLVRVPGVCNFNQETTILAHINGAGVGIKNHDLFGSHCCFACHTWLDGGYSKDHTRDYRDLLHLQGMMRTQQYWLKHGYIVIQK